MVVFGSSEVLQHNDTSSSSREFEGTTSQSGSSTPPTLTNGIPLRLEKSDGHILEHNNNSSSSRDLEAKTETDTSPGGVTTTIPPKPVMPEGGLRGWLAVLGCWCIMFNTFGYIQAFGIFEAYYKSTMLPHESQSTIAWIGSIQVFFMFSAGLISGPLMDRYGPKPILIPCSFLFILSVMLTSICREYYQFILAQGILGGLTNGLTYTPALTAVGHYFLKKRPLAMGIASTGASISGITLPIALSRLLNRTTVGFGGSVRVLGFVMLALSVIACVSVSSSAPKRRSGPPLLLKAWKNRAYSLQVAGTFLVIWAVFVPFFYLPGFGQSIGLSVDLSFYLLAILNAASLFGRLLGGAAADRMGRINTLSFACLICSILIFCWLPIHSHRPLIAFAALFGFFSGTVIAVFPATIAMTAPQPNEIGSYLGMALGVYSFAGLSGTPITGAMINDYNSYRPAITFAGVSALLGALVIFASRYYIAGTKLIV